MHNQGGGRTNNSVCETLLLATKGAKPVFMLSPFSEKSFLRERAHNRAGDQEGQRMRREEKEEEGR